MPRVRERDADSILRVMGRLQALADALGASRDAAKATYLSIVNDCLRELAPFLERMAIWRARYELAGGDGAGGGEADGDANR